MAQFTRLGRQILYIVGIAICLNRLSILGLSSLDALAGGDADKAICIRGDLSSRHSDGGCLDTKVTMGSWVKDGKTAAVNGPTLGGTGAFLKPGAKALPPFTWDSVPAAGAHAGLPDKWEFEFEEMQPAAWL